MSSFLVHADILSLQILSKVEGTWRLKILFTLFSEFYSTTNISLSAEQSNNKSCHKNLISTAEIQDSDQRKIQSTNSAANDHLPNKHQPNQLHTFWSCFKCGNSLRRSQVQKSHSRKHSLGLHKNSKWTLEVITVLHLGQFVHVMMTGKSKVRLDIWGRCDK